MHFFCRVKVGDAHWGLYGPLVVAGGAEPWEDGAIVRAWNEDPMVFPRIPMPQCWRWVPEGTACGNKLKYCIYSILIWTPTGRQNVD